MNLIVVKLGGSSLQEESIISSIASDVKKLYDLGFKILLVHGGGPAINEALVQKNIVWEFIEGQRKTSEEMMTVIEATLFGVVNRRIQKIFSEHQLPVLGLSGTDLKILECDYLNPHLGKVGQVKKVNVHFLNFLIQQSDVSLVPLIAPIGVDDHGQRFNINADVAAKSLAIGLKAKHLVYMTDQEGIWDSHRKTIHQIDSLGLYQLIQTQVVQGGMLVKVQSVLHALKENVQEVDIIDARKPGSLFSLIQENKSLGTRCYRQ